MIFPIIVRIEIHYACHDSIIITTQATEWVKNNAKFIETEFKALGGIFENAEPWNSHVVEDGNLVTCQNPQSAEAGAKKVIEILSR